MVCFCEEREGVRTFLEVAVWIVTATKRRDS